MKSCLNLKIVINEAEKFNIEVIADSLQRSGRDLNLEFVCKKHGKFRTSIRSFLSSKFKCKRCSSEKLAEKTKNNIKNVKDFFIKCGYEPLFDNYQRSKQKLKYRCPSHGIKEISFDALKTGKRCRDCSFEKIKISARLKEKDFNSTLEDLKTKNITPLFTLQDHKTTKTKMPFKCEIHGKFVGTIDVLRKTKGCRKCTAHHSKLQSEVFEYIKEIANYEIEENYRKIIFPYETDVYCSKEGIGIEFAGLWWHNEFYKSRSYHKNKLKKFRKINKILITIFEDEWRERKVQIKGLLKSLFKKNSIKIYARKTEIKKVNKKDSDDFLEKYHIQGTANHIISYGLFYKNELIGLITGSIHHRKCEEKVLVLNRMVFKHDISIAGGASKLLKKLMSFAKENGYRKIISWSDNRWSEGNVYKKIGFNLKAEYPPDYSYVLKEKRYSKQSLTKKVLKKKGAIGNTEKEMALSLGYRRIWDCGKKKWEIDLNKK